MKRNIEDLLTLDGKVAIVTGGAMGIGKSIVTRLTEAGASVLVVDIAPFNEAQQNLDKLRANGAIVEYMESDLSKIGLIYGVVKKAVQLFGRIDILVNNAGIFKYMSALEMTEEMWDRTLDLNLKSAAFLAKEVAAVMIDQGMGGRIINISSVDSFIPTGQLSHYDASKGGLRIFTKALAKEVGKYGITVNDIAPGGITTPGSASIAGNQVSEKELSKYRESTNKFAQQLPLQRMGEPDDIAHVVLFMASRASAYMTGSTLVVDGGMMLT